MSKWLLLMHLAPVFCFQWWLWEQGLLRVTPMSWETRAGVGFLLAATCTVAATAYAVHRKWIQ